LAIAPIFVAR